MLKGKSVIELTDVHTGKKEHYEDTNLVTEAAMDILNCNLKGMLYAARTERPLHCTNHKKATYRLSTW